ncbi:ACP S-malonyltransferase [Agarilytica rhodophyticola]|uniref:ACP S-malonyltransferase n=1 Tax=Agarilytica rhodophyticola TaxID=1737490 RepID=UPI000B345C0C|nr:ACP S-malonyltransferase [Agarilytica rhodophyticola]
MDIKENLAIVFPGQGSQKVGMLADYAQSDILTTTFADASDALGYDMWEMVVNGPQEKLTLTEITQPVLLTCSTVLWRIWQERNGRQPAYLAGHSLGEWSALVAAEVIAFSDAVKLVRARGKYMQEAVPAGEGAMAAIIGLEDEIVEAACEEASAQGVVSAVNYNSPGQLVIAGEASAVNSAVTLCSDRGARKAMLLPVSAPFHTSLMKPAADRLAKDIENTQFSAPKVPVVHNVNGEIQNDAQKIKDIMVEQIYSPVRWVSCVEYLAKSGVEAVVECGPGKVLCGLNRRIDKSLKSFATETNDALQSAIEAAQ